MVADLMPIGTEAPRCSEFARRIDLLPPGTGLYLDRVIVIDTPLPWPKPALNHDRLRAASAAVNAAAVNTRLFAAEPAADSNETRIEVYERSGAGATRYRWHGGELLKGPSGTADARRQGRFDQAVGQIAAAPLGGLGSLEPDGLEPRGTGEPAPPTLLVCTQGSHDVCCGESGVELADQLERLRPDVEIRRVSHTGGHRFAPTLLALPQGRMWAYADMALVDRILADTTTAQDHRHHDRGWWGARVGYAQAAEVAVRAELAPRPFVEPVIHAAHGESEARPQRFRIVVDHVDYDVAVRVGRTVATIACESPGGLPTKPGREFAWTVESVTESVTDEAQECP